MFYITDENGVCGYYTCEVDIATAKTAAEKMVKDTNGKADPKIYPIVKGIVDFDNPVD